jgi:hypothetical protein
LDKLTGAYFTDGLVLGSVAVRHATISAVSWLLTGQEFVWVTILLDVDAEVEELKATNRIWKLRKLGSELYDMNE